MNFERQEDQNTMAKCWGVYSSLFAVGMLFASCLAAQPSYPANEVSFSPPPKLISTELPARLFDSASQSRLENIPVSIGSLWMSDSSSGLTEVNANLKFPILRVFGSPPPIVKVGWDYTRLRATDGLELPEDLYQYTLGVSTVRVLGPTWSLRSMLGVALSTDQENNSRDSWQFRGGIFGIRQINEYWQLSVGAIALGRDDIPVVPAVGLVWAPNEWIRWDLILPDPKINFLIQDDGVRQKWLFLGGSFNGTTWGYDSPTLGDDRLTYSDLRLVAGWKSSPWAKPGSPYVRGRKYIAELGYAFNRELEFNREQDSLPLDDAFFLRIGSNY